MNKQACIQLAQAKRAQIEAKARAQAEAKQRAFVDKLAKAQAYLQTYLGPELAAEFVLTNEELTVHEELTLDAFGGGIRFRSDGRDNGNFIFYAMGNFYPTNQWACNCKPEEIQTMIGEWLIEMEENAGSLIAQKINDAEDEADLQQIVENLRAMLGNRPEIEAAVRIWRGKLAESKRKAEENVQAVRQTAVDRLAEIEQHQARQREDAKRLMCPLLSISAEDSGCHCIGEKCAWFDNAEFRCALVILAGRE